MYYPTSLRHHEGGFDLMKLYEESRRHLLVTALKLFRCVDHIYRRRLLSLVATRFRADLAE